ncbi:zinc finger BED domain-containing protein 4-like [Acanthochromis polyacanthus]|uniref:zinc finger BED domain-containing protein 4-like n=1 Tax=Acanthochromis polyacanthus TaxID=80966 RepID=UPI002234966C|nr:zinc finger BED domain-containing protein 4-like [Acanthochromis polyacanthus]XP_051800345.1 zinc finger BED domain-containing protein 4-like [Acanthochromis polyacanthus]XP_051800346.1 zinc finger BED domain-containing protein 4-like [Acanthochromis polyacanthus]
MDKAKSAVWKHYSQPSSGKAVCKECNENVSMGSTIGRTKNTSNLWSHLRTHHPELYQELQKKQEPETHQDAATSAQPTIEEMFNKQRKWSKSDDRSKLMDRLILEMIVTDNQPFTVVSDVGFKRLMAAAEPRYALKSDKYYRTEKLKDVHQKVVDKIKSLIKPENAGHSLSFTTDCWSGNAESLMSLTCHYIDAGWSRKQAVLNTRAMHGSHTGEYLKETLLTMLEDWNINKDRVALVLRDSGANIVKGLRLSELPDLSCTAHTLQLVVNDGLTSQRAVTDVIAILKRCATHFHHSILAKHLRKIQGELGLPEHSIIQAVPTRWNSTLHVLQRMQEQKRALTIYSGEHRGFAALTAEQWDLVSNLIETLLPIEEVTLEVSHSNSSASCIIPSLTVLKMLFQNDEGPNTRGIRTLRQTMRESLDKRFSKIKDTKIVVLACLLDPRYKSHAFSSATTLSKAKRWLQEEDASTQETTQSEHAATEGSSKEEQCAATETQENEPPQKSNKEYTYLTAVASMRCSLLCWDLYLKEPVIDRRKEDPLQWWKRNEGRFKILAKHARKFLCAPPSKVQSERLFSEVSTVYDKRSRLTGEHAEQLCFLHHNLVLLNWDY